MSNNFEPKTLHLPMNCLELRWCLHDSCLNKSANVFYVVYYLSKSIMCYMLCVHPVYSMGTVMDLFDFFPHLGSLNWVILKERSVDVQSNT